jgi:hTAFII28-like protein conserved region
MKRARKVSEDLDASDLDLLEEDEESKVDEEQLRFFSILNRATPEQNQRYEVMHATYLFNPSLGESDTVNQRFESLIRNIIGTGPSKEMLCALAATAKIYVGELIESALEISKENKDIGHLAPSHIQEARRRLKKISKRIL